MSRQSKLLVPVALDAIPDLQSRAIRDNTVGNIHTLVCIGRQLDAADFPFRQDKAQAPIVAEAQHELGCTWRVRDVDPGGDTPAKLWLHCPMHLRVDPKGHIPMPTC